jgi:hypothetical protein
LTSKRLRNILNPKSVAALSRKAFIKTWLRCNHIIFLSYLTNVDLGVEEAQAEMKALKEGMPYTKGLIKPTW